MDRVNAIHWMKPSTQWTPLEIGFGYDGLYSMEVCEEVSGPSAVTDHLSQDDPFADTMPVMDHFTINPHFPGWCFPLNESMSDFTPSNIQKKVFQWYDKNKRQPGHVLIDAQTGSGKTLAFTLPLLHCLNKSSNGSAIVIAPTRELVNQIYNVIQTCIPILNHMEVLKIQGGISEEKQIRQMAQCTASKRIIVATPGRLGDYADGLSFSDAPNTAWDKFLSAAFSDCKWLVIDEFEKVQGLEGSEAIGKALVRSQAAYYISVASATPDPQDTLLGSISFRPTVCSIETTCHEGISHCYFECNTQEDKDLALYYFCLLYTSPSPRD